MNQCFREQDGRLMDAEELAPLAMLSIHEYERDLPLAVEKKG
jgi:hypothetical protein